MEIQDIKQRLTLSQVLKYYNLKPDKQNRLNCPFHDDKTPSFQAYYRTHTCYCFSSNCKTNGKSLDVIDFIMYKEGWEMLGAEGKHKAIEKAEIMINGELLIVNENKTKNKPLTINHLSLTIDRTQFLTNMFTYFKNAVHNSKPAQDYIKQRGLDKEKLEVGYNSGQFHHGNRKDEHLIAQCLKYGLLLDRDIKSKTGDKAYRPFGKYCIVFALRNRAHQVTGLYLRSTVSSSAVRLGSLTTSDTGANNAKHYYLKDRSGLYPHYPKQETEKLILTEAIIDAASLLQIEAIASDYSVLACYGTNGLTEEHKAALQELKQLKEVVFAFDNDEAGHKAVEKYARELLIKNASLRISKIELPCKDVNETLIAHQPEIFTHLLENRLFLFSNETALRFVNTDENIKYSEQKSIEKKNNHIKPRQQQEPQSELPVVRRIEHASAAELPAVSAVELDTKNPYKLRFVTDTANYYIQGGISKILDSMKVTIVIENPQTQQKARNKVDLYEDKQVEKLCKEVSEKLNMRKDLLETDINRLTDLLDEYRETQQAQDKETTDRTKPYTLTEKEKSEALTLANTPGLVKHIAGQLGQAGIVGEEKNRIFLFVAGTSHNSNETLHVLIQGTSGSGKTRLFRHTIDCIPQERVIRLTRVSDKSFYNYQENFLSFKVIGLEDVDGLSEEADYAYRELVSNGELRSSVSIKDESGKITSGHKIVKGPIASMACTTNGSVYEDNVSRMFIIAVDESKEQTRKIIAYQNAKSAGKIDIKKEQEIKQKLQNFVRLLKNKVVLNPYAEKIHLPEEADQLRRLNDMFKIFIHHITRINQYQRRTDAQGRLISTLEDLETAIDIMFDSIVLKVDELNGSLRQFYEKLKEYIKKVSSHNQEKYEFTQREIRHAFNVSKSQLQRYLNDLSELEYIQPSGGFANKGFKYKIVYWDDYKALRERIKKHLYEQLETLKGKEEQKKMSS